MAYVVEVKVVAPATYPAGCPDVAGVAVQFFRLSEDGGRTSVALYVIAPEWTPQFARALETGRAVGMRDEFGTLMAMTPHKGGWAFGRPFRGEVILHEEPHAFAHSVARAVVALGAAVRAAGEASPSGPLS
jgi:hypothetical protein